MDKAIQHDISDSGAVATAYAEEYNADAISLGIAGVYESRRKTSCVLRLMISNALAGRPTYYGNGSLRNGCMSMTLSRGFCPRLM